ncbi:carbohydrate ABC transporter permease [Haloactinopolyspora sp.]|uniref:carbohydrate ABC transporter permease n=1 Tax=Haloactinopolyspora sp. TaxID=1966353 RepID=UPI002636AF6F|nr:carbohydrate ABC transporter permease [Haloactinopolyspora sp.]
MTALNTTQHNRVRRPRLSTPVLSRFGAGLSYLVLIFLTVFGLLPVVVMIATSFKPADQIFRLPATLLPSSPTLTNYVNVFTSSDMPRAIGNSVLAALLTALITILLGGTAGYAIARIRFRGTGPISIGLLLGQLLPVTVLLLPLFKLVSSMGVLDTIPGVVITHLTIVLPLVTWMATSTVRSVPVELEEAAMIDGCTRLRAVRTVVLPVAAPGIVALGIFSFLQSWNEFVFASVVSRSMSSRTAPVALTDFAGQFQVDWGATMAAATVISLPITIVFLLVQRYFIQGMSAGAVKG